MWLMHNCLYLVCINLGICPSREGWRTILYCGSYCCLQPKEGGRGQASWCVHPSWGPCWQCWVSIGSVAVSTRLQCSQRSWCALLLLLSAWQEWVPLIKCGTCTASTIRMAFSLQHDLDTNITAEFFTNTCLVFATSGRVTCAIGKIVFSMKQGSLQFYIIYPARQPTLPSYRSIFTNAACTLHGDNIAIMKQCNNLVTTYSKSTSHRWNFSHAKISTYMVLREMPWRTL